MKKGFTIVEVLVVIGIIAILTTIILPSINNIRKKNRDTERVADIANIQLGLSLYKAQKMEYPSAIFGDLEFEKYVTLDTLTPPTTNAEYQYIYVPLKRNDTKCTYYHLGTKLELPSGQIDGADTFDTKNPGDPKMNGYNYCGSYNSGGLAPGGTNYNVHP